MSEDRCMHGIPIRDRCVECERMTEQKKADGVLPPTPPTSPVDRKQIQRMFEAMKRSVKLASEILEERTAVRALVRALPACVFHLEHYPEKECGAPATGELPSGHNSKHPRCDKHGGANLTAGKGKYSYADELRVLLVVMERWS